jgi:hypothetical protein
MIKLNTKQNVALHITYLLTLIYIVYSTIYIVYTTFSKLNLCLSKLISIFVVWEKKLR